MHSSPNQEALCLVLCAVVAGGACDHASGNNAGDGGGDGGGGSSAHVTIQTGGPPALVAFRNEADAQWRSLGGPGVTAFDAVATGPYRVVVVCEAVNGEVDVHDHARTPADDPTIEDDCRNYPFFAQGDVVQPGAIFLGNYGVRSSVPSWSFDLPAVAGSFDLVMLSGFVGAFDGIAIRRGVVVDGDTQLGTIDLGAEISRSLVQSRFTPANFEPGEQLFSDTLLHAGNTVAVVDSSFLQFTPAWATRLAPDVLLQTGDRQIVTFSAIIPPRGGATMPTRVRSVSQAIKANAATPIALPEPVEGARFELSADRFVATWRSLPQYDELSLQREGLSSDGTTLAFHEARLTSSYINAVGATSAVLDVSDLPGLQPAWRPDPMSPQVLGMFADRGAASDDRASSGIVEVIASGPSAAPAVGAPDLAERTHRRAGARAAALARIALPRAAP